MAKPKNDRIVSILILLGIAVIVVPTLYEWYDRARQPSGRQPCPSALRQIGQAILLYSNANGGWCPPDLQTLVSTQNLDRKALYCPSSPTVPYAYTVGGRLADSIGTYDLVAYDPLGNHGIEAGSNVLFGDGHVEYLDRRAFIALLKQTAESRISP